jgi:hypothetical protein
MSSHPLNLVLRFILEIVALIIFAVRGYYLADNWTRFLLAVLLPVIFAVIWGVFAVPEDPSRSGKTVVKTPGMVRLMIELVLFSAATGMISGLGKPQLAWIFGILVLVHYLISYDRITWLLKQR